MNSPSYLTDLTLSHFDVEMRLSSETMNELRGIPHYTQSNGDVRWPTIKSELFHRVCLEIKPKQAT